MTCASCVAARRTRARRRARRALGGSQPGHRDGGRRTRAAGASRRAGRCRAARRLCGAARARDAGGARHDVRIVCGPRRARAGPRARCGVGQREPGHRAGQRRALARPGTDRRTGGGSARRGLRRQRCRIGPHPLGAAAVGRGCPRRAGRGAVGAAAAADGRRLARVARDARWLVAVRAGRAGAVLAGRPLLSRRLECAACRQRQHGPAGGHRHQRCLRLEPGTAADGTCWPDAAPVLRIGCRGDHAGAVRQVARGARQTADHRRDPRAACAAPRHRTRAARRRRGRAAAGAGAHRRRGAGAAGRTAAGRRRSDRRRAAMSTSRCSPARACRWPNNAATA